MAGSGPGPGLQLQGERRSGQDVRTQNITAVAAIANIVKSSLGPVGLDKVVCQLRLVGKQWPFVPHPGKHQGCKSLDASLQHSLVAADACG